MNHITITPEEHAELEAYRKERIKRNESTRISCHKRKTADTWGYLNRHWKEAARKKAKKYEFDIESLKALFQKQNGLCVYSGLPMSLTVGEGKGNPNPERVSLDRVDSTKDYTFDNVVMCRFEANMSKSTKNITDYQKMIIAIYNHMIKPNVDAGMF